jgi:sugar fermentation stimulation protein A
MGRVRILLMDYIHRYRGLVAGTLQRRYKRFLADVTLTDGTTVTAFCPNSGSMMGLVKPGTPVMLSVSDNPARKTRYTLELLRPASHWVAVNTLLTNSLAETIIRQGRLAGIFGPVAALKREVTVGRSRLDMLLEGPDGQKTYIEVKSVTLRIGAQARFPDAVTVRGTRHLGELVSLSEDGNRAAMLYLVQRGDCRCFSPAQEIDPVYSRAFREAQERGVAVHVVNLGVNTRGVYYKGILPLCG